MGESRNHIELVSIAYHCALTFVPKGMECLVKADTADSEKPSHIIDNFIPDVFYWHDDLLIIGEAKTINDFDKPHSKAQYKAYLQECQNFSGKSILIISVPWQLMISAKNYFKLLSRDMGKKIRIIIINEINVRFEI